MLQQALSWSEGEELRKTGDGRHITVGGLSGVDFV